MVLERARYEEAQRSSASKTSAARTSVRFKNAPASKPSTATTVATITTTAARY